MGVHTSMSARHPRGFPPPLLFRFQIPRVELEPCGPSMDLRVRRVRAPPHELQQEAMKQPKELKKKKVKTKHREIRFQFCSLHVSALIGTHAPTRPSCKMLQHLLAS